MPTFKIICLANSRKHSGRCVAGLRTDGGGWLRLCAPTEDGALQPQQLRLTNGSEARVLDVLQAECDHPQPQPHHPEDWIIGDSRWRLVARPAGLTHQNLIRQHAESGAMLLGNWNDRTPYDACVERPVSASLTLVAPQNIVWIVREKEGGGRQMRVAFTLTDHPYELALTDPVWEQRLNRLPIGRFDRTEIGPPVDVEVMFTVSLGEPFQARMYQDACCYKLVAAVIVLPPDDQFTHRRRREGLRAVTHVNSAPPDRDLSEYPDPFPELQGEIG